MVMAFIMINRLDASYLVYIPEGREPGLDGINMTREYVGAI